jgi:hypothetical protein
MLLDRTNHTRLAAAANARIAAAAIADRYIPAVDRQVTPGDNGPPEAIEDDGIAARPVRSQTESAQEATVELNDFLTATPVIETLDQAKLAGDFKVRTSGTLQDLDKERDRKVRPLNEQVKKINDAYKVFSKPLGELFDELRRRLKGYGNAERARREAEAERVRAAAEVAERAAITATVARDEAIEDASLGTEVDVGALIKEANAAERLAARAGRQAQIAERDAHVRIPSSMGRAISSRKTPIINVIDAVQAVKILGLTEKIAIAIRQSALAYEEAYGELPAGVTRTYERRM